MNSRILIAGASARAAAVSAKRAGCNIIAADLFVDQDLSDCCRAVRVDDYPTGLVRIARECKADCWLYTGALENHPTVVNAISQTVPLLGCDSNVLRAVRCPLRLERALREDGLSYARVALNSDKVRGDGSWLRKPRASAGGRNIRRYFKPTAPPPCADDATHSSQADTWYFQEKIRGTSCSATFVGAGGRASLLGITDQLVGLEWTGATGFQYCGSICATKVRACQIEVWNRIGDCLSRHFGLRGLFGVDAVKTANDVYPVEVNPRYTASVEVVERSLNIDAMRFHIDACGDGILPPSCASDHKLVTGKAILFAQRPRRFGWQALNYVEKLNRSSAAWPSVVDIPRIDSVICSRQPITTFFSTGANRNEVLKHLKQVALDFQGQLEAP